MDISDKNQIELVEKLIDYLDKIKLSNNLIVDENIKEIIFLIND
jgi:hypothetical protein